MKTNVFLIRHGRTVWNQERRLQGHHDIELDESGIRQAEDLAAFFDTSRQSFSHIYSSDLKRASKTAAILAQKLGISSSLSTDLRERDMGEWGGRTIEDICAHYPNWMEIRSVGGVFGIESTQDLAKRMMKKLQGIVNDHPGEWIAVVSHGGAINSVLTHLSDGEFGIGKTNLENTSISHLQFDKKWIPVSIGMIPHLSPL